MAILSYRSPPVERFHKTGAIPKRAGWAKCAAVALRKLDMLNAAAVLEDLRSPPGNQLEALKGNLRGYYSIRINQQWRVIFRWKRAPTMVDIVDYH